MRSKKLSYKTCWLHNLIIHTKMDNLYIESILILNLNAKWIFNSDLRKTSKINNQLKHKIVYLIFK